MPRLDGIMKDINDMAESGARYTEMPHVIEVVLPMLCNYLPRWWERGPDNFPEMEGQLCTEVTSEHLNQLLGSIMKIVVNNLGIDEASWMKRLAGECCLCFISVSPGTIFVQLERRNVFSSSIFAAHSQQGKARNAEIPLHSKVKYQSLAQITVSEKPSGWITYIMNKLLSSRRMTSNQQS